ncbi:MAG: hypothetical protein AAFX08_07625 [Pseudomonadota bacterium]
MTILGAPVPAGRRGMATVFAAALILQCGAALSAEAPPDSVAESDLEVEDVDAPEGGSAPAPAKTTNPVIDLEVVEPLRPPAAVNEGAAWKIVKTEWDDADERGYAAFVRAIGWSNCTSLESCLADPANPYRHTDKRRFSGDCADMAYTLRAYYAWKNGLPFSYQSAMGLAKGSRGDLRYSTGGNVVAGRRSVASQTPISAPSFIARIPGEVSTAMFRTHPETGGGRSFDDFYPVEISREAVRPGAIAYDVYGHVSIVYDVLDDGRVLIIASHPDRSVTRTAFRPSFMRTKPALGGGLKEWRPIRLEGATKAEDGSYRGGRIRAVSNDELPSFSMEQYVGNNPNPTPEWGVGEYRINGREVHYQDYVRLRLASSEFRFNPVTELRNGLETICGSIRDRKFAVDAARSARMHLRPHPGRLPPNIFGTYGDWETYSTPSRDARLKVAMIELRREVERMVNGVATGAARIGYDGDDLKGDLWSAMSEEFDQCKFTYWRSDNSRIRLNMSHVFDRIWGLSFDPYHCPERRWGANGAELVPCTDDDVKSAWYNAQRYLRYQAERTYDVRMDFTLDQLKPPSVAPPEHGGLGVDAPADADIASYIAALPGAPVDDGVSPDALVAMTPGNGVILTTGEAREFDEPRFPEWHYKIRNSVGGY